jgi:membrane protease subunit HflC
MSKTTVIIAAVVIALFVVISAAVFVDETEYVIIVQFGKPKRTLSEPGLAWKTPFAEKAIHIEKRMLASDAPESEYLTADKKRLVADPITRWRVIQPLVFYKSVNNENYARKRLDEIVLSELRQELAKHTMGAMVGGKRGPMMANVTERVRVKATDFGIEVVDVRIKRLDLPKEVQRSVFDRMVAERERLAKGYRAQGQEESDKITSRTDREQVVIIAKANKRAEELRGEGDAHSTQVYADAYGKDPEFYSFLRNLEAYEKSMGKEATMVMSTGSKLFRYLTQPGKAKAAPAQN